MKIVYRFFSTGAIVSLILQISSCVPPVVKISSQSTQSTPTTPISIPTSPQPSDDEKILGRWYAEHTYQRQNTTVSLKATTEYFPNKRSNSDGELSISGIYEGKDLTITYDISLTGTWLIHNRDLTETTDHIKSSIKSITSDGITVDREKIPQDLINSIPKPEDFIVEGTSESSTILSLTQSELQLKGRNSDGNSEVTTYHRRY